MSKTERPTELRYKEALSDFWDAMDNFREAQDPVVKNVLLQEAKLKLHAAVAVEEEGLLLDGFKSKIPSPN